MPVDNKLLATSEALAYLADAWGFRRSPLTLSRWLSAGIGPHYRKVGRYRYFTRDDLDAFMRAQIAEPVRPRANDRKLGGRNG
jgi:hypothetical protein